MIFDEVITGLRTPGGSIGNETQVQPDLYTLGKVIGGGLPVGAYGGRAEVMDQLAPLGPVYQAGTLSGNPIAVAAGLATLDEMDRCDVLTVLERLGGVLEAQVRPVLERSGHPFSLVRRHSLFWLAYGEDKEPRSINNFHSNTGPVFADLHRELLKRGFMLAPSAFEVGFLSLAHTDQHLVDFAQALEESLAEVSPR